MKFWYILRERLQKTSSLSKRSTISRPRDIIQYFIIHGREYMGSIPNRGLIALLATMLIKFFGCHRVLQKLQ